MPRKRFSRLRYAMRALQSPTGTGTPNQPPAGSVLYNYEQYRSGAVLLDYPDKPSSKPGSFDRASLIPFAVNPTGATEAIVPISNRVAEGSPVTGVFTAANLKTTADPTAKTYIDFIPAKAIIFVANGSTPVETTSKITGIPYDKQGGDSYTVPYGSSTTNGYESDVRTAILAVTDGITNATVSFQSEKYKG